MITVLDTACLLKCSLVYITPIIGPISFKLGTVTGHDGYMLCMNIYRVLQEHKMCSSAKWNIIKIEVYRSFAGGEGVYFIDPLR